MGTNKVSATLAKTIQKALTISKNVVTLVIVDQKC